MDYLIFPCNGCSEGEVDLAWDSNRPPPATTSASFTFPNLLAPGGGDLVIPANGLTRKGNAFALTGSPLGDFAASLIGALRSQNYLTPNTPTTQLTSSKITLANPNPQGKTVDRDIVRPSDRLSRTDVAGSPVLSRSAASDSGPDDRASHSVTHLPNLTLDWLSNTASVHADVTIELSLDNKPLGSITSLTFSDSAGDIAIVKREAHHYQQVIHAEAQYLARAANDNQQTSPGPGQGSQCSHHQHHASARWFDQPGPVLVESPFEIDTDPFTAKTSAVTRQRTMPVAGRGSAPIGSLRPGAAAQDPAAAGRWSTLGRGVGVPPLRDSSIAASCRR